YILQDSHSRNGWYTIANVSDNNPQPVLYLSTDQDPNGYQRKNVFGNPQPYTGKDLKDKGLLPLGLSTDDTIVNARWGVNISNDPNKDSAPYPYYGLFSDRSNYGTGAIRSSGTSTEEYSQGSVKWCTNISTQSSCNENESSGVQYSLLKVNACGVRSVQTNKSECHSCPLQAKKPNCDIGGPEYYYIVNFRGTINAVDGTPASNPTNGSLKDYTYNTDNLFGT
ncbi:unnamed protein product, partial [marine sediment metagenome]